MGRDLQAYVSADHTFSVTYWTGIWEPKREGISKEVEWLRAALAPGFTPG